MVSSVMTRAAGRSVFSKISSGVFCAVEHGLQDFALGIVHRIRNLGAGLPVLSSAGGFRLFGILLDFIPQIRSRQRCRRGRNRRCTPRHMAECLSNVARPHDQCGFAVADELIAAHRIGRMDGAGNGKHFAALIERQMGGDERARTLGRFHDQNAAGTNR